MQIEALNYELAAAADPHDSSVASAQESSPNAEATAGTQAESEIVVPSFGPYRYGMALVGMADIVMTDIRY